MVNPLLMLYQYQPPEYLYNRDTSDYEQGAEEEEEEEEEDEEEETDYETDKPIEASDLTKTDPNNQLSFH